MKKNLKVSKIQFQVSDFGEDSVVFNRLVNSKGRTKKEMQVIENSLPKATIHYFNKEDFIKLKELEKDVLPTLVKKKEKSNIIKKISSFLELSI